MKIEMYLNVYGWENNVATMITDIEDGPEADAIVDYALTHATHSNPFGAVVVDDKIIHLHMVKEKEGAK